MNMEYLEKSYESTMRNNLKRENAWKDKECIQIYEQLIKYAGGFGVVRKGMRGQAKQLAINAFIKNTTPDFELFKSRVVIANGKYK